MAKKKTDETPAQDASPVVRVLANSALYEGGVQVPKGAVFETTEARMAALGDLVSTVDTPE